MARISIIILSFNTKDITRDCLDALIQSLSQTDIESQIIVVDNASEDGSQEMISSFKEKERASHISFLSIFNQHNEGFPKGNNAGLMNAEGDYVLFLNSDVIIGSVDWKNLLDYMDSYSHTAALTVRVNLPTKKIDPASHRGFPTIWNSFCYYSKLELLTKKVPVLNRFFGGYHLTHLDLATTHEVDAISGAFFMARASVLRELEGFDETFFMYGEDIDLAYRMKEKGYKIVYYPHSTVTHLKYQSGIKKGHTKTENKTKKYFYDAMRIFYRKHYAPSNPFFVNKLVYLFIDLKEQL